MVHIINLLEKRRARSCHYPLGILGSKRKRIPEINENVYVFQNTVLCDPISSSSMMASDESWKEIPCDTPSPIVMARRQTIVFSKINFSAKRY